MNAKVFLVNLKFTVIATDELEATDAATKDIAQIASEVPETLNLSVSEIHDIQRKVPSAVPLHVSEIFPDSHCSDYDWMKEGNLKEIFHKMEFLERVKYLALNTPEFKSIDIVHKIPCIDCVDWSQANSLFHCLHEKFIVKMQGIDGGIVRMKLI